MENTKIIQCMKCKHYQATYNPARPRGCKLFGIESQAMPYIEVRKASGTDCQEFSLKATNDNNKDEKIDYNDPKYWN